MIISTYSRICIHLFVCNLDADEELRQRCSIQSEKIEALDGLNQELLAKLYESQQQTADLKEKLDLITVSEKNNFSILTKSQMCYSRWLKSLKVKLSKYLT